MYEVRDQDDRAGPAGPAGPSGRPGRPAVRAGGQQADRPGDRDSVPGHGPARGRGLGGQQLGTPRVGRPRGTPAAVLLPADPGRRRAGAGRLGGDLPDPGQAPRDPEHRAAGRAGGAAVTGVLSGRAQPGPLQADLLAGLRGILQAIRPDADLRLIRRAYDVAAAWHDGQTRFSGDPYITHPLAVAAILAGLGASDQALCAALLHDTTALTAYTFAELNREFGTEITGLVAGIAALDQITHQGSSTTAQAIAAATAADPRVLAIKIADRLHNMRTVEFLPPDKQLQKAAQARDVFVPAARLLRLGTVESELAALASTTLSRNRYARTASGHLLTAMAALLPPATQGRWREEWLGELHTLPARRSRARFTAHTLLGVPRLAVTLRRPAPGSRQARP